MERVKVNFAEDTPLCQQVAVIAARGGKLTGVWAADRRRELGRRLLDLPASILVLPMRLIGYRMAELAEGQRVSSTLEHPCVFGNVMTAPASGRQRAPWASDTKPFLCRAVTWA